ncbi:hypothetical protein MIR68_011753 [Amoeboaphelidium protococcarum]|nr:hypothetical protein MIR68_011753 [Amoeboaphelidium protococcarum]
MSKNNLDSRIFQQKQISSTEQRIEDNGPLPGLQSSFIPYQFADSIGIHQDSGEKLISDVLASETFRTEVTHQADQMMIPVSSIKWNDVQPCPTVDMNSCSLDQFLQVAMQQRLTPMLLIPTDRAGMRVNVCMQLEEVKQKLRLSEDKILNYQDAPSVDLKLILKEIQSLKSEAQSQSLEIQSLKSKEQSQSLEIQSLKSKEQSQSLFASRLQSQIHVLQAENLSLDAAIKKMGDQNQALKSEIDYLKAFCYPSAIIAVRSLYDQYKVGLESTAAELPEERMSDYISRLQNLYPDQRELISQVYTQYRVISEKYAHNVSQRNIKKSILIMNESERALPRKIWSYVYGSDFDETLD